MFGKVHSILNSLFRLPDINTVGVVEISRFISRR